MKKLFFYLFCCVALCNSAYTQGTSCSVPVTIALDGVLRNYPSSSATGSNVLCTNNGVTPVTWFRFTTNAQAECPLLNITASDSSSLEVAFYTSCSSMLSSSSMCFYSGFGLWAPNENFLASANTTYYLRVKTSSTCTIKIAGQHYTPPNSNCIGAMSLSGSLTNDNNACNHADPNVTPSQLCALTLENTAWYQFYVATNGYSIITISNIHCDNGAANNNSGFQMGFFTGNCSSLEWLSCSNGSGPTVQATTPLLTAGTKVFLAIDGISGANCSYSISGLNVTGVLSGTLRNFSGWKSSTTNMLQWTTLMETGGKYIIERSSNGIHFTSIGQVNGLQPGKENATYHYDDTHPPLTAFYRLKLVDSQGRASLSEIIKINRQGMQGMQVSVGNPVTTLLQVSFNSSEASMYIYTIVSMHGQRISTGMVPGNKGANRFSIPVHHLPGGQYTLTLQNDKQRLNTPFFKK